VLCNYLFILNMCQHKVLAAFLSEIHTLYRDEKKLLEYAVTYGSKGEGAK